MIRFVGFYEQLKPLNGPSVYLEDIGTPEIQGGGGTAGAQLGGYLRNGYPILDVMELTTDVLGGTDRIAGGSSVLTDGLWVWRWDLAHYVERYDVPLPDDFISRVHGNSFVIPNVEDALLDEISLKVSEMLGFRVDPGCAPR
ncbi:hypothetical protein [Streptomyces corynorhini]|uniref:hypothetical protein n=1 Tax=Streptomyces corynorhini TaxID=2282652 RepID=UPI0011C04726|nr:hypothetical protein [Streptomyces corynorhini]